MRFEFLMDVSPYHSPTNPPFLVNAIGPTATVPVKHPGAVRYLVTVEVPDPRLIDAQVSATVRAAG